MFRFMLSSQNQFYSTCLGQIYNLTVFFILLISLLTDFIIVYYYSAFLAAKTISFLKFVHK